MVSIERTDIKTVEFFLQPNQSASLNLNYLLWALIFLPPLSFAVFLFSQGYWLVLPFAGLDFALLLIFMRYFFTQSQVCELIKFSDTHLILEKYYPGGKSEKYEWPRAWVSIVVEKSRRTGLGFDRQLKHRILIKAYGQEVEIADFLGAEDSKKLVQLLKKQVANYQNVENAD